MTKHTLLSLGFLATTALISQAATVVWGGAGSSSAPRFWISLDQGQDKTEIQHIGGKPHHQM